MLHAVEIVKFLLTLKQFGPISQKFAEFDNVCTPHLLETLNYTTHHNLKAGYFDLLSDLIKEMGIKTTCTHLSTMPLNDSNILRDKIEKKLNISLPMI